ncbi:MAG: hypothetical protein OXC14_20815 [Rhodospirillaceae bacterium]|nr:hypothetical protein [Rhodospirillaceae bacterium]
MNPLNGSTTVDVPKSILEQFQYVKEIYSYSGRVAEALGRRVARITDHKDTERMDLCIKLYAFNGITQRLGVLCRIPDHEFRPVQTGLVRQILEYAALGRSARALDIANLSTDPNIPNPRFVDRRTREPVKTYGSAFVAKFLLDGSAHLKRNVDTIYGDTSGFVHPSAYECLTYVLKPDGSGYLNTPMGIQGYADLLMSIVGNLSIVVDQQHHLRVFSESELAAWQANKRRRRERRSSLNGKTAVGP